jgi:VWFA-related protein
MLRWFSLLVVFALSSPCLADNVTFLRVDKSVVQQRLQPAPSTPEQRVRSLRAMFEKAGCTKSNIEIQAVPDQAVPNVLCSLPGTEFGTILISARLDYDGRGDEGALGWGGVVMLPLLAESMVSTSHRHTLVFAAFSGSNMAGASFYWKSLSDAQRREFRGMVDLDHLGRTAAGYSAAASGAVMARLLPSASHALQLSPEPQPIANAPDTDALFFQRAHVPSITIHSAGYVANNPEVPRPTSELNPLVLDDVRKVAGTPSGSFALKTGLDPDTYNQTYNLLCVYVLFLDRGLGASKHPATEVLRAQETAPAAPPPVVAASVTSPAKPVASSAPVMTASTGTVATSAAVPSEAAAASSSIPTESGSSATVNPAATIKVNTRLVQFDVVVTDSQGRPVKDLTAADFTVLQDGQPQTVRAFEVHSPATVEKTAVASAGAAKLVSAALPTNTFTNVPTKAPQSSWTIILFDLLNTGVSDQAYARNQLLQLLKAVPRGEPVALFVLTRNLEMLQGFTRDPGELLRQAEMLDPSKSQLLTTMVERERTISSITSTAEMATSAPQSPSGAGGIDTSSFVAAQVARLSQGYNDHEAFRTTDRAIFTLEAMRGIARAVSGYPGRKNLVWLSGSFPVQIEPDPASTDPFRNERGFENEIRTTSSLLATSRVAVYPVDVRGLQSQGIDISVETAANQIMRNAVPDGAGGIVATSPSTLATSITAQSVSLSNDRATMKTIAEQTGGEAFVNTNDLKRVINRSLDDGSTYYTLAYTPPKEDAGGGYRRVVVKIPNKGLKLAYRRGYYSIPPVTESGTAGTAALRAALQPGMPPATSMLLTASIELPDAARKEVKINYVIDSDGVDFADVPDGKKRAQLDCMVIAFDSSGKEVAHASDTLDATVPLNAYAAIQKYGLPAHQLLSLPPGNYNLRIGVMDRTTQQIGTVDAPLVVAGAALAQR